jgi:hypothetical protein
MNREELKAKLEAAGFVIRQIIRMGDDDGWRAMLMNGAVIHCFDDGRCIVHGPSASLLRTLLRAKLPPRPVGIETPQSAGSSKARDCEMKRLDLRGENPDQSDGRARPRSPTNVEVEA